jgi:hypothetical protein
MRRKGTKKLRAGISNTQRHCSQNRLYLFKHPTGTATD